MKIVIALLSLSCLPFLIWLFLFTSPERGTITETKEFPGSFRRLGTLGKSGVYCYERRIFSERLAARIEGVTEAGFEGFSQTFHQNSDQIDSSVAMLSFDHFVSEFSPRCEIHVPELGMGRFGTINFGKHSSVRFFYSKEKRVMVIYGVKTF